MKQEQKRYVKPGRVTSSRDMQEKIHEDTKTRSQENAEAIEHELDDLLDEIDEALGENAVVAEEFLKAYQQKGGE